VNGVVFLWSSPVSFSLVPKHLVLMQKTMEVYVLPAIGQCAIVLTTFDLWMSRSGYDTFALVINFISSSWVPCHIIVRLSEALNISKVAFKKQVKVLLVEFNLISNVIVYVKDERTNLNSFMTVFTFIVSFEPL